MNARTDIESMLKRLSDIESKLDAQSQVLAEIKKLVEDTQAATINAQLPQSQ